MSACAALEGFDVKGDSLTLGMEQATADDTLERREHSGGAGAVHGAGLGNLVLH